MTDRFRGTARTAREEIDPAIFCSHVDTAEGWG